CTSWPLKKPVWISPANPDSNPSNNSSVSTVRHSTDSQPPNKPSRWRKPHRIRPSCKPLQDQSLHFPPGCNNPSPGQFADLPTFMPRLPHADHHTDRHSALLLHGQIRHTAAIRPCAG